MVALVILLSTIFVEALPAFTHYLRGPACDLSGENIDTSDPGKSNFDALVAGRH